MIWYNVGLSSGIINFCLYEGTTDFSTNHETLVYFLHELLQPPPAGNTRENIIFQIQIESNDCHSFYGNGIGICRSRNQLGSNQLDFSSHEKDGDNKNNFIVLHEMPIPVSIKQENQMEAEWFPSYSCFFSRGISPHFPCQVFRHQMNMNVSILLKDLSHLFLIS